MMNTTDAKLSLLGSVVATALILGLLGERRAWSGVDQANGAMRVQLSQMDALLADNQRLLALLPIDSGQSSQSIQNSGEVAALDEPAKELLRLRGEAEVLRQESKAIEALREDTRQTRLALEAGAHRHSSPEQTQNSGTGSSGSQLEILRALYWTDNAQTDVTDELRDRIRGDSLKAIASNNIKGDPEFGQVKHLTIEYRYAGVTLTNEFREGALVVLPPETTQ